MAKIRNKTIEKHGKDLVNTKPKGKGRGHKRLAICPTYKHDPQNPVESITLKTSNQCVIGTK